MYKRQLLRQLKPALAPHGVRQGRILFRDAPLEQVDQRTQAARIGFVQQSPENQIVTDKVWHELAFGMESLGFATPVIRRRVAEMASFFGIEEWFSRPVEALSGGQKQLLAFGSVYAMGPEIYVLDEPTANLDFGNQQRVLAQIRALTARGYTVLLSTHNPEHALHYAHRVLALQDGHIAADGPTETALTPQLLQTLYGIQAILAEVPTDRGTVRSLIVTEDME